MPAHMCEPQLSLLCRKFIFISQFSLVVIAVPYSVPRICSQIIARWLNIWISVPVMTLCAVGASIC